MFLGSQPAGTQHSERPRRHAIAKLRSFDQIVVGKAMEGPGKLLGMDSEPASKALEGYSRGRILRQEFEDLAVVFPQVERGSFDARFAALWHHRWAPRTS